MRLVALVSYFTTHSKKYETVPFLTLKFQGVNVITWSSYKPRQKLTTVRINKFELCYFQNIPFLFEDKILLVQYAQHIKELTVLKPVM